MRHLLLLIIVFISFRPLTSAQSSVMNPTQASEWVRQISEKLNSIRISETDITSPRGTILPDALSDTLEKYYWVVAGDYYFADGTFSDGFLQEHSSYDVLAYEHGSEWYYTAGKDARGAWFSKRQDWPSNPVGITPYNGYTFLCDESGACLRVVSYGNHVLMMDKMSHENATDFGDPDRLRMVYIAMPKPVNKNPQVSIPAPPRPARPSLSTDGPPSTTAPGAPRNNVSITAQRDAIGNYIAASGPEAEAWIRNVQEYAKVADLTKIQDHYFHSKEIPASFRDTLLRYDWVEIMHFNFQVGVVNTTNTNRLRNSYPFRRYDANGLMTQFRGGKAWAEEPAYITWRDGFNPWAYTIAENASGMFVCPQNSAPERIVSYTNGVLIYDVPAPGSVGFDAKPLMRLVLVKQAKIKVNNVPGFPVGDASVASGKKHWPEQYSRRTSYGSRIEAEDLLGQLIVAEGPLVENWMANVSARIPHTPITQQGLLNPQYNNIPPGILDTIMKYDWVEVGDYHYRSANFNAYWLKANEDYQFMRMDESGYLHYFRANSCWTDVPYITRADDRQPAHYTIKQYKGNTFLLCDDGGARRIISYSNGVLIYDLQMNGTVDSYTSLSRFRKACIPVAKVF